MACTAPGVFYAYVNYTIWFTNESEYNFALGVAGGVYIIKNPTFASTLFNAPIASAPDYTASPGRGVILNLAVLTGATYTRFGTANLFLPIDVDEVVGGCVNNEPETHVLWQGRLQFVPVTPPPPADPDDDFAAIPKRRWITGFEYEFGAEGTGNTGMLITRDASRTVDGVGATIRSNINQNFLRAVNVYQTGFTTRSSWERFYVRIRTFSGAKIDFWKSNSSPSPTSGIRLYITPSGAIECNNVNSAAVETVLGTSSAIFTQNIFVRFDILVEYNASAVGGSGRFRLYVNGTQVFDFTVVAASGGLGQVSSFHTQSLLGTQTIAAAHTWEIDFDDWINADIPTVSGVESLNSLDWIMGSHVTATRVVTGTITNWSGQVEMMNQMMSPLNTSSGARLTSSTALATLDGTTDLSLNSNSGFVVANIAAIINKFGTRVTNNGRLGYKLAGGSAVMTAITESAATIYNSVAYLATGTDVIPPDITPFHVVYEKGNGSDLATVYALSAVVEQIGSWGIEDDPLDTQLPSQKYAIHNGAYYANSPWSQLGADLSDGVIQPTACSHGGTYIGNGTTQTISVDIPFHFLWVRPLTGGTNNGFKWFSTGLTGHLDGDDGSNPGAPVHVFYDPVTQLAGFTVTGTDADVNANGVTYQYCLFADPTSRYNLCGAFEHRSTVSSTSNPLFKTTFTPVVLFTQFENVSAASTNIRLAYKGPGFTGNTGGRADGTGLSNYASLGTGSITSLADLHVSQQTTYSAWRLVDGSPFVMVQATSYVGDGTASRNIALTPTSGAFPLLAIVFPHNSVAVFRDPSHTGVNSGRVTDSTNNLTTGITGGAVDQITVGILLNALGITYDVFVIVGSPTAWENGEFCNNNPNGVVDPLPLPDIALLPEGGLILGGSTPLSTLRDVSGLYTLIENKTNDTLYDRQTGQTSVDVAIPDPQFKTGYIGG